ncbi:MAG: hypothetical protein M1836_003478 [Candelina mexicana]|nr:MAG: hypothetical protein M1836_003478 [Candelina mexicana]
MRTLLCVSVAIYLFNAICICASFDPAAKRTTPGDNLPRPRTFVCDESYGLMVPDNCRRAVQNMPASNHQNLFGNWDVPGISANFQLPQWFVHGDCVAAVYINLYPDDVEGYLSPGADTDVASWGGIQAGLLSLINHCSTVPAAGGGVLTKGGYDITVRTVNDPAPGSTVQWTKHGCRHVYEDISGVACPRISPPMGLPEPTNEGICGGPRHYCTMDASCCKGANCITQHMKISTLLLGIADARNDVPLGTCSPLSLSSRNSIQGTIRNELSSPANSKGVSGRLLKNSDRGAWRHSSIIKPRAFTNNTISVPISKRKFVRRDESPECLPEFGAPSATACRDALAQMPGTTGYKTFGQWFTEANEPLPQSWSATRGW